MIPKARECCSSWAYLQPLYGQIDNFAWKPLTEQINTKYSLICTRLWCDFIYFNELKDNVQQRSHLGEVAETSHVARASGF